MLIYGVPDDMAPEYLDRFPRHGWADDGSGGRSLWFPICTALSEAKPAGIRPSDSEQLALPRRSARAFTVTLRKLAINLRELASLGYRTVSPGPTEHDHVREVLDRAPLHIDLAFIYLRRLSDYLVMALRRVLFQSYSSKSNSFGDFRKRLMDPGRLLECRPVVESRLLDRLMTERCAWFEALRDGGNGIRDVLEHQPVYIETGIIGFSKGRNAKRNEELAALASHGKIETDLLIAIKEICEGFCDFLTELHRIIGVGDGYRTSDGIHVTGEPDARTRFWPQI